MDALASEGQPSRHTIASNRSSSPHEPVNCAICATELGPLGSTPGTAHSTFVDMPRAAIEESADIAGWATTDAQNPTVATTRPNTVIRFMEFLVDHARSSCQGR